MAINWSKFKTVSEATKAPEKQIDWNKIPDTLNTQPPSNIQPTQPPTKTTGINWENIKSVSETMGVKPVEQKPAGVFETLATYKAPYDLFEQPVKPLPKSYSQPIISQGKLPTTFEKIISTIQNTPTAKWLDTYFGSPIRSVITGMDDQQLKETNAQRETDLNILEGLGKKISKGLATKEDRLTYKQAESNINRWIMETSMQQALGATGGMEIKNFGKLEAVTQKNFSRINELMPDLKDFAKANPDKSSAQFLVKHLEQSQKTGMINPQIQQLIEGKTGNSIIGDILENVSKSASNATKAKIVPSTNVKTPVTTTTPAINITNVIASKISQQPTPTIPKATPITSEVKPEIKTESPLAQEARKYKSAEEFSSAIFGKGTTDMSNVELNRIGRLKSISEGGKYGYDFPNSGLQEGWTRMDSALKDFPELKDRIKDGKVTIYRASPTAEIKPGDWVSTSDKYVATNYLGNDFGRTKLGKIEVSITDLYLADVKSASKLKIASDYPTQLVEELVYAPKSEIAKLKGTNFTDIYNQAVKTAPEAQSFDKWLGSLKIDDPLVSKPLLELKKYFNDNIASKETETTPKTTPYKQPVKEYTPTGKVKTKRGSLEKPVVESKIEITTEKQGEELVKVIAELENAQAGKRVFVRGGDRYIENVLGQPSTFPKWIPEKLRKKTLTEAVLNHINNDTIPVKADEVRLYNVVAERVAQKEVIKEIGEEEGIDVSSMFADEINDKIPTNSSEEESYLEDKIVSKIKETREKEIVSTDPILNLKREVNVRDTHGEKIVIKEGEALTPYQLKGGNVLLKDGVEIVVQKSQYENVKNNAIKAEAKEFAPELKGTEETIKGTIPVATFDDIKWSGTKDDLSGNLNGREFIIKKEVDGYYVAEKDGLLGRETKNYTEAVETLNRYLKENTPQPKYSQYTLPGGKNYKEVLIKAPKNKVPTLEEYFKPGNVVEGFGGKDKVIAFRPATATRGWEVDVAEIKRDGTLDGVRTHATMPNLKDKTGDFKSSHWDEPNVISHLRLNERTYNGKKVTFMEELQSDWAREARKESGYKVEKVTGESGYKDKYFVRPPEGGRRGDFYATEAEAKNAMAKMATPQNPLLKNWQELSIKRALKEAVDNNSEYFAWINGEQTSARYNLATYVEKVEWGKSNNLDADKFVLIRAKEGKDITAYVNADGTIRSGGQDWKDKKLDEVLGKGLADKIMSSKEGTLSGEGLKFGGEWANTLYDKQVGNIVKDLTGAEVVKLDMGLTDGTKDTKFYHIKNGASDSTYLTPKEIKVGLEIADKKGDYWIISSKKGVGKFTAISKKDLSIGSVANDNLLKGDSSGYPDYLKKPFDISTKKSPGQQAIKLTPEVKAKIKGEAPKLKQPSGLPPFKKPEPLTIKEEAQELASQKWGVKLSPEALTKETISKTDIMVWAEKVFGFPIRSKATHKWSSAGVFYPKSQIIRMKTWGELSVATHEIAHGIDKSLIKENPTWRRTTQAITKELADLDYDQNKRRTSEGFAEYMRYRMTTDEASKQAPEFHKFFEEVLNNNPKLKANLAEFKNKINTWQNQGAENRIIKHIDWKGEHVKTGGLPEKIANAHKFIQEKFNDEFYVPQKIVKEIEATIGRKLTPTKNPAIMMEYYKSKSGAVARTFVMDNAIDEYGNILGPSLKDILKPIKKEEMTQFIAYAVAKRAINLQKRNIESGFEASDTKFIVEKYQSEVWDNVEK